MSSVLDDSCVAEVRAKYAEDLEDLLQCPVCMERPTGRVRVCKVGHHICQGCWSGLRECPTCKVPFSGDDGRNFLAEELSSKLNEYLSVFAPQPIIPGQKTIECRMGNCQSRLPTERMCDHIRDVHPSSLLKLTLVGAQWVVALQLAYDLNKMHSYSLEAQELGLFFVVVSIDQNGDALYEIQVAHSRPGIKLFKYSFYICIPDGLSARCKGNCSFGDKKGSHICKITKNRLKFYFKNGKILDEEKKKALFLAIYIEKSM